MEVYAYTITNGKVKEYFGTLNKHPHMRNRTLFLSKERTHPIVCLSENEGEVRGRTVWFNKPSLAGAKKAFDIKAKERAVVHAEKCKRTIENTRGL